MTTRLTRSLVAGVGNEVVDREPQSLTPPRPNP